MVSPLSASLKFTPSGAFGRLGCFALCGGRQGAPRPLMGGLFLKKETQKLSIKHSVAITTDTPKGKALGGNFTYSAAASAAAEYYKKRDDYDPDPMIIKKIAKTVVHTKSSLNISGSFLPLGTIL